MSGEQMVKIAISGAISALVFNYVARKLKVN